MTAIRSKRFWVGLAVGAAFALASATGFAADASKEVRTAATHANFAHKSMTLKMVHTHLHHVVNCLVGPNGKGFTTKVIDPCKGQGNGAIPDTTSAAKKKKLESALVSAMAGLKATKVADARAEAQKTLDILKKAE